MMGNSRGKTLARSINSKGGEGKMATISRIKLSRVIVLILLVAAIVTVACASDEGTLAPTVTAAPTTAAAEAPALTIAPTEAPQPTATLKEGSRDGSIRVLSSQSAPAPALLSVARFGDASPSPIAQRAGGDSGLTVSARGSVTVEADQAYVDVVVSERQSFGPFGPQPMSSEDRAKVIENLAKIGIKKEDIEFEPPQRSPFPSISVEVEAGALPEIGEKIVVAVEGVLGRSQASGVRFSLSEENCGPALALARRAAIPRAAKSADDLAAALGVKRGGVMGAVEYPASFGFNPFSSDRCGSGGFDGPYGEPSALLPFDAEPKTEVSVHLQVTYALE